MAKKEKAFNYAQADTNELHARLEKTQQELFKTRFRVASAPVSNTMQIRKLRREVARIYTFINQRPAEQKAPVAKAPAAKAAAVKAPAAKTPAAKTPAASGKAKGK